MNPTSRRNRSISAKVTDDEYKQIVSSANPKTVIEWARAILVHASEPIDIEFVLLAEFLALRTIILNLHFSLAEGGRNPSIEAMKALIDRADAEKLDRAQRRIAEKEVPTLSEFASRFLDGYARANRQKPSGIAAKETILNVHLLRLLGSKRLDAIGNEDVQRVKHNLRHRSPKTVNNVLTVLNVLVKKAVEWNVLDRMPCTIRLLPIPKPSAGFYDFDDYERLVEAARTEPNALFIVLLGGEAGLRCGEMMALEWRDVDLTKRQICVQRSEWKGHVTVPKGGRLRYVPMTVRLAAALRDHRHLRGPRVLCQPDGSTLSADVVKHHVERAARRARLDTNGVHRLRHTFCSHLAMRGAPARAIQELAGHQDLTTTQRYMHLSPAALEGGSGLLDEAGIPFHRSNMVATGSTATSNSSR